MSKPAIVLMGALGVVALAVLLGMFALRDKRPRSAPPEAQEPVAAAIPSQPTAPATKSLPPLPPPLVAGPRLRKPSEADAGKRLDDPSVRAKLHAGAGAAPPLSLQLAREAVARFPDSPNAPEFEWNVVKALANMQDFKAAEEEARGMVKKYPGNDFAADVDRHLLHHPPNPPPNPP